MANSWNMIPGINHVGAYQVSGAPFAEAEIDASSATQVVTFPYVTQWIEVYNYDNGNDCKVGFSALGASGVPHTNTATDNVVHGKNYFAVPASGSFGPGVARIQVKVSHLYLAGSDDVHVVAGLTNILPRSASGSFGPSWSGSSGVG
tara:strand:- start:1477 stop:1917 length:441 start_codon:yes stop_codon:yes gene_type:complete